jgi:saccharopine dehydrogenase-like NADP-dependent oxidoreductase
MDNGEEVIPLKVVKACLPDPASLAQDYKGKTCIGNLINGMDGDFYKSVFIYNVCDHESCYAEVGSQGISYTAGVPAAAAVLLWANGVWDPGLMVNVEELPHGPFISLLSKMGLTTGMEIL